MSGFAALGDPIRRQIVEALADGELAAGTIAQQLAMTPPAVSHHLRVLREANLVYVRVHGQRRLYSLNPIGFGELAQWLAHMEKFWMARLNLLDGALRDRSSEPRKRPAKKRTRA
jgi:DNA-binding transcriptional ArsR family regulator